MARSPAATGHPPSFPSSSVAAGTAPIPPLPLLSAEPRGGPTTMYTAGRPQGRLGGNPSRHDVAAASCRMNTTSFRCCT